ncbi:MAG: undecaprenyl-phosphate glucose phosphotransferase [Ignavibacteria bacterium]
MTSNKNIIYYLTIFADFILLNIAFTFSASFAQSFRLLLQNRPMFVLCLILNIIWFFSANVIEFYEDSGAGDFVKDIINILKNSIIQAIVAVFYLFLIKENLFTRNFILYYFLLLVLFITVEKIIFVYILKYLKQMDYNIRKILIVGSGEIGTNFYNSLINQGDSGYRIIGFLDDGQDGNQQSLGRIDELNEALRVNKVDDVVIALPYSEFSRIEALIKICNRNAIRTHIIPDYFRFVSKKFKISMIDNLPIITVRNEPLAEFYWRLIKRIVDIILSLIFIVFVLSWVLPLVALIQKLTSPGSIFFIQERVGQKNRYFYCLKFRSMSLEASAKRNEVIATTDNDPRVTKFGKFLRKSNVDEFPQFFNVLMGDMSIVGPRPAAVSFNELYAEYIDELKLRNIVKPGITGWAQVNGLRGDCPDEEGNKKRIRKRFDYDLWYIENWSLMLDFQIILLTFWQILKRKNLGQ